MLRRSNCLRRRLGQHVHFSRQLQTSRCRAAASNLNMPALSPTMTEGQIAAWKVQVGDKFSAGDVLLELETDKAQMDVEAQDDGIVAKITVEAKSRTVQIGETIAVLAEQEDDFDSLDLPEPEGPSMQAKEVAEPPRDEKLAPKKEELPASQTDKTPSTSTANTPMATTEAEKPLLPSVMSLLQEFGISDVKAIRPTGPRGQILKGDVLAFAGKIASSKPGELQTQLGKLSALDLSNVKILQPAPRAPKEEPVQQSKTIETPIALDQVLALQQKLNANLSLDVSINTFISRAASRAFDEIPQLSQKHPKSLSDVFFDEFLTPKVAASTALDLDLDLPPSAQTQPPVAPSPITPTPTPQLDIIDFLASKSAVADPAQGHELGAQLAASNHIMTASLTLNRIDEVSGFEYLRRFKHHLENPGGLIL